MFEKALIYRAGVEKLVDIGVLAETLFFYGSTQLLLDRPSVVALAKKIPHDVLIELFDRDALNLSYVRDSFAVLSQGALVEHDFGAMQFHANSTGKRIANHQEEIAEAIE